MNTQQNNTSKALDASTSADKRFRNTTKCLSEMCQSFDSAENRQKFKDFPEAYCHTFNLTEEQIHAVTDLDILRMLKAGGNIECIAKLTQIYDLSVQDLAIQQTGKNLDELLAQTL